MHHDHYRHEDPPEHADRVDVRVHLPTLVAGFLCAAGRETPPSPAVPSEEKARLCLRVVGEQIAKLAVAAYGPRSQAVRRAVGLLHALDAERPSVCLPALVDAAVDVAYATEGLLQEFGVGSDAAIAEVHRANMAKVARNAVLMRPDGKVIPFEGWRRPDVAGVLAAQGWTGRDTIVPSGRPEPDGADDDREDVGERCWNVAEDLIRSATTGEPAPQASEIATLLREASAEIVDLLEENAALAEGPSSDARRLAAMHDAAVAGYERGEMTLVGGRTVRVQGGGMVVDLEPAEGPPTVDQVSGLMMLVVEPHRSVDVPKLGKAWEAEIARWTDGEREAAADWAASMHVRASDNDDVEISERPACVLRLPARPGEHALRPADRVVCDVEGEGGMADAGTGYFEVPIGSLGLVVSRPSPDRVVICDGVGYGRRSGKTLTTHAAIWAHRRPCGCTSAPTHECAVGGCVCHGLADRLGREPTEFEISKANGEIPPAP